MQRAVKCTEYHHQQHLSSILIFKGVAVSNLPNLSKEQHLPQQINKATMES